MICDLSDGGSHLHCMMSEWTSERAILRDLSRAQGGAGGDAKTVHGRRRYRPTLDSCSPRPHLCSLRAAERPSRVLFHEETEEEHYERCVEDVAPQRPDLALIKRMLNMVREQDVAEDDPKVTDVVVIGKLDPTACIPTMKPPTEGSVLVNYKKKITKKVRPRNNVALESILQLLESREQTQHTNVDDGPITLLKPEDLITNSSEGKASHTHILEHSVVKMSQHSEDDENVKKVKTWLTKITSPVRNKPVPVILEATNMFREKSKPTATTPGAGLVKDIRNKKPTTKQLDRTYKPSTTADDYYKKYLDKSRLIESLQDDIWTKAEKKMKRIDEKRRHAAVTEELVTEQKTGSGAEACTGAEACSMAVETDLSTDNMGGHEQFNNLLKRVSPARALYGWMGVRLPTVRHSLTSVWNQELDCPVCAALYRWRHRLRQTSTVVPAADDVTVVPAADDVTEVPAADDVTALGLASTHSTPEWIPKDGADSSH